VAEQALLTILLHGAFDAMMQMGEVDIATIEATWRR